MNKECSGFTLIELVTVIILAAILATYAVVKWPSDGSIKLYSQANLLASHMRHTQALAMHWGQSLRLTANASGYSVSCVSAAATPPCNNSPVLDPATAQAFSVLLESGLALSGSSTIDFDSLGRPVSGGSLVSASPAGSFTLSAAGSSKTVAVNPLTGFVSISP